MQPLPYLVRPVVLGARTLLDSLGLVLDGRGPLRVLALGLVQSGLRFGYRLVVPFPSPLPGGLFAPALGVAALLLLLEIGGGLSVIPLADLGRASLRRFGETLFLPSPVLAGFLAPTADRSAPRKAHSTLAGHLNTTPALDIVAATTLGSSPSFATP